MGSTPALVPAITDVELVGAIAIMYALRIAWEAAFFTVSHSPPV